MQHMERRMHGGDRHVTQAWWGMSGGWFRRLGEAKPNHNHTVCIFLLQVVLQVLGKVISSFTTRESIHAIGMI